MKRFFWEAVHQLLVHPMLFFTRNANCMVRFHDYTKEKAWKKEMKIDYQSGYTAILEKVREPKKGVQK